MCSLAAYLQLQLFWVLGIKRDNSNSAGKRLRVACDITLIFSFLDLIMIFY